MPVQPIATPSGNPGEDPAANVAVVVVAAGRGTRAGGGTPKQYRDLSGIPVIQRTLSAFVGHPRIFWIQPVIAVGDDALYAAATAGLGGVGAPIPGGATRQESVRAGLEALAEPSPRFVLIHDAARPFVAVALIDRVLAALDDGADAALPCLPVFDTLKRVDPSGEHVTGTEDRAGFRTAQTPQGFRYDLILAAHRTAAGGQHTDDAAILEAGGRHVRTVPGDAENAKLTTEADFQAAERRLALFRQPRVGHGYDVHRLASGGGLTLCGIHIPGPLALIGHSDADVALHAITDALLGALGAGDIGEHFPPSDPQWKGADSTRFLAHALDLARNRGGIVAHVDVTVICERPRLGPHKQAMRAQLARILGIDLDRISVKATTTERLGFTGRGEGIAAEAVVTLML